MILCWSNRGFFHSLTDCVHLPVMTFLTSSHLMTQRVEQIWCSWKLWSFGNEQILGKVLNSSLDTSIFNQFWKRLEIGESLEFQTTIKLKKLSIVPADSMTNIFKFCLNYPNGCLSLRLQFQFDPVDIFSCHLRPFFGVLGEQLDWKFEFNRCSARVSDKISLTKICFVT